MEYSPEPLVEWTDGTRWYEVAPGELRAYAAGVDLAGRGRETRAFYTTHAAHALSDLARAERYPERRLLTLERDRSVPTRPFHRVVPVPDAPTRLRFPDRRTHDRAAAALHEAVRPPERGEE